MPALEQHEQQRIECQPLCHLFTCEPQLGGGCKPHESAARSCLVGRELKGGGRVLDGIARAVGGGRGAGMKAGPPSPVRLAGGGSSREAPEVAAAAGTPVQQRSGGSQHGVVASKTCSEAAAASIMPGTLLRSYDPYKPMQTLLQLRVQRQTSNQ